MKFGLTMDLNTKKGTKEMKLLIFFIFELVFGMLFLYLLGCFYFVTWDINLWTEWGRMCFVSCAPVVLCISAVELGC